MERFLTGLPTGSTICPVGRSLSRYSPHAMPGLLLWVLLTAGAAGAARPRGTADSRLGAYLAGVSQPLVLPRKHPSHHVNVNVTVALNYLVGINEKAETMTAVIWVVQQWENPLMAWNRSEYEGISSFVLSSKDIWTPNIWIEELIEAERADESVYGDYLPAVVYDTGTILIYPTYHMTTSCNLDFYRFPYDRQHCRLTMVSWTYGTEEVTYHLLEEPFTTFTYTKGEWALISFHSVPGPESTPSEYPKVNLSILAFEMQLQRNPLVQVMNILFPLFTLNLIMLASLFMESDAAGRMGLGTTAFLAYTVLLLIIMEKLPASSTSMPFIGVVFMCSLVFTLVVTLWAVALGKLFSETESTVTPGWIKVLLHPQRSFRRLGGRIRTYRNKITTVKKEKDEEAGGKSEVILFVRLVDRFLFVVYLMFNIITGLILTVWAMS